jgi:uncharacterized protein (DUF697 family)/tellurite resistance protein
MSPSDTRSIATIAVLAAFVDGEKHDRERAELRRIAETLGQSEGVALPTLVQDVLMKRVDVAGASAALTHLEARQLAYEMAVCVCDADGAQSPAEAHFLADLRQHLNLGAQAGQFAEQAESLASAPLAATGAALTSPMAGGSRHAVDDAALDKAILDAAILNGALELLPETLSTLAIIPLQMRLVYRIGEAHGYPLDGGHVKDFLATAGVGLTSQYLEQAGRKLLGGVFGKLGGGLLGGLGRQAVSSGMSFASTYALGHVAKRYYGGGRTLSAQMLKDSYARVVVEARDLQGRYLPDMQARARGLDAGKVLALVRGQ